MVNFGPKWTIMQQDERTPNISMKGQGTNAMTKMPEYVTRENCGKVLKALRQRFGISVADLAKTLGVARSTIMRIEAGQTVPSDDILNRLKAIQVIGISRLQGLSEAEKQQFLEGIEGMGEHPELFARGGMFTDLTPAGILAGLGTIASASLNISASVVSSIPVLSSLAAYGLVKGLKSILEVNNLSCVEKEGVWEIQTGRAAGPHKEGLEMNGKRRDEEKTGGAGFDFGLGGLFKGLGTLIDAANKLAEKGEELSKSGEIDFSGLDRIKGLKDLKGVYGVRVRTMADGRPSVEPFGNIKRTPKGPVVEEVREPIVDVFDESDGIHVVAEMPGIEEADIHISIRGDILDIRAEGGHRKYQKEILLSREAAPEDMTSTYKNGILEVRIRAVGH
jgi:HSP20 family protein